MRSAGAAGGRAIARWYNQDVGVSMVKYARLGQGRRLHFLDTTHVEVPYKPGRMRGAGWGKRGRTSVRGLNFNLADAAG